MHNIEQQQLFAHDIGLWDKLLRDPKLQIVTKFNIHNN